MLSPGIIAGRRSLIKSRNKRPNATARKIEPKLVLFVINMLLEDRLSVTNAQRSVHHRTYVLSSRKSVAWHFTLLILAQDKCILYKQHHVWLFSPHKMLLTYSNGTMWPHTLIHHYLLMSWLCNKSCCWAALSQNVYTSAWLCSGFASRVVDHTACVWLHACTPPPSHQRRETPDWPRLPSPLYREGCRVALPAVLSRIFLQRSGVGAGVFPPAIMSTETA